MKIVKKIFLIALMTWFIYIITVNAQTATINTDGARMRREPNTTSDVLTVVYNKETVEIIEEQGDWYKVKYGEYEGYIRGDLMDIAQENQNVENNTQEEQNSEPNEPQDNSPSQEPSTQEPETFSQKEKIVKADTYAKIIPSFSASSILELKAGQKVLVIKQMNKWCCVEINGKSAWVLESTLTEKEEQPVTPEEQAPIKMYIDVSAAVLRSGPSTSSEPIAEMYMGRSVEVLGEEGDWYKVKYEDKEGYVAKRLLSDTANGTHRSLMEERSLDDVQNQDAQPIKIEEDQSVETQNAIAQQENYEVIKTVYVNTAVANLREGSSTNTQKIGTAKQREALEVIGEENGWYKIKNGDAVAYILKDLTVNSLEEIKEEKSNVVEQKAPQIDSSSSTGEAVVSYAKQFLGYPYVYGGAGPSSFDCSGFTKYVYGHFGISLSHSAVTQANNGVYVQKSELNLGDLVIFRDWDNASIGHCGIYIGGGRFIHAANSKRGVVTDTLNSGYYYERYVSGRRLF